MYWCILEPARRGGAGKPAPRSACVSSHGSVKAMFTLECSSLTSYGHCCPAEQQACTCQVWQPFFLVECKFSRTLELEALFIVLMPQQCTCVTIENQWAVTFLGMETTKLPPSCPTELPTRAFGGVQHNRVLGSLFFHINYAHAVPCAVCFDVLRAKRRPGSRTLLHEHSNGYITPAVFSALGWEALNESLDSADWRHLGVNVCPAPQRSTRLSPLPQHIGNPKTTWKNQVRRVMLSKDPCTPSPLGPMFVVKYPKGNGN